MNELILGIILVVNTNCNFINDYDKRTECKFKVRKEAFKLHNFNKMEKQFIVKFTSGLEKL